MGGHPPPTPAEMEGDYEDYLRKEMRMSEPARDKLASIEVSAAKVSN